MAQRREPSRSRRQPSADAMVDQPSQALNAAARMWQAGRQSDATAMFDATMRQEANNVQAYIVPARAYGQRYQFERMEQTLDALVRRAPGDPGVHHYVAETYGALRLPLRATRCYEIAAALPGAGPPTWMELASLYERGHRLDEAEQLIERAVASGYDLPLVWLVRGRIARRQMRLADAESSFRTVIERAGARASWSCEAWGELALMKDAQGDYDGAADAIEQCKRLQRSHRAAHQTVSEAGAKFFREFVESLSKDDFRRWRDEAVDLPPHRTGLLTGFPRSGTTLLEQVLDAHPELVSSEERDFLGNELLRTISQSRPTTPLRELLNGLSADQIRAERQRYLRSMEYLLGEPIGSRLHLDKNPAYNLVIPLLLRVFPEARLIIALRDPRDVVLSCYLRYLPLNAVSVW
ncbi:MAG TPA: sulfotransferase, partial [Lacipirellula sp.]